jgi:hypothetical protein
LSSCRIEAEEWSILSRSADLHVILEPDILLSPLRLSPGYVFFLLLRHIQQPQYLAQFHIPTQFLNFIIDLSAYGVEYFPGVGERVGMGTEVVDCMELEIVGFCALLQDVYRSARMLILEDRKAKIMNHS